MKPSPKLVDALASVGRVDSTGKIRRIGSEMLLALARGEVSAADVDAASKMIAAISLNIHTEVRLAVAAADLRAKGANLAKIAQLGQAKIDELPEPTGLVIDEDRPPGSVQ